jgi:hypothetical protein
MSLQDHSTQSLFVNGLAFVHPKKYSSQFFPFTYLYKL